MTNDSLPEGFGASPDPVEENPFKKRSPQHREWKDATRIAEERAHRCIAEALGDLPPSPVQYQQWLLNLMAHKFNIWAERNASVVWSNEALPTFDQWLLNYANSSIQTVTTTHKGPGRIADLLPALKARLAGRVAYWKAVARRYLAQQRLEHGGLTNAEMLRKKAAERARNPQTHLTPRANVSLHSCLTDAGKLPLEVSEDEDGGRKEVTGAIWGNGAYPCRAPRTESASSP